MPIEMINVTALQQALRADSPGGSRVTAEEIAACLPGEPDLTQPHSLSRVSANALAERLNSIEADGTRLSAAEVAELVTIYHMSRDALAALAAQSRQSGVKLFAPSAELALGITNDAETSTWADIYAFLQNAGLRVSRDDVTTLMASPLFEQYRTLFTSQEFFSFIRDTLVPHFLPRGVISPGARALLIGGRNAITDERRIPSFFEDGLIYLYTMYGIQMRSPEFLQFVQCVQENYAGIEVIHNIDNFLGAFGAFHNPTLRQLIITTAPRARQLTALIPISGLLDAQNVARIDHVLAAGSIAPLAAELAELQTRYGITTPITLEELEDVQTALADPVVRATLHSPKAAQYIGALGSTRPHTWGDVRWFAEMLPMLPDDVTLFARAVALLQQYHWSLDIEWSHNGTARFHVDPHAFATALAVLVESPNIRYGLARYDQKFFTKFRPKPSFTPQELIALSQVRDLTEFGHWIAHTRQLSDPSRLSNYRNAFPLAELHCLAAHPETRDAVMHIFHNFPAAVASVGLGCDGMAQAEQLLELFSTTDGIYHTLITLGITDITWTSLVKFSQQYDFVREPKFQAALTTLFAKLDPLATPAQKKYLHSHGALRSIELFYRRFPKAFLALADQPATLLGRYLPLMRDDGIVAISSKTVRYSAERPYPVVDGWGVLAIFSQLGIVETAVQFADAYQWPLDANGLSYIANIADESPEMIARALDPAVITLYTQLTATDAATRYPFYMQLPALPTFIQHGVFADIEPMFAAMQALPYFAHARVALLTLDTLHIQPTWQELAELFAHPILLAAFTSSDFLSYWILLREDASEAPRMADVIAAAKLTHFRISHTLFRTVREFGANPYLDPDGVLLVRNQERTLHMPGFRAVADFLQQRYLSSPLLLDDLATIATLYREMRTHHHAVPFLRSDAFTRALQELHALHNARPNVESLLYAYRLASSEVDWGQVHALAPLLGRTMVANDLLMLATIAHDPELTRLWKDRAALETAVQTALDASSALPRKRLDGTLHTSDQDLNYTERPALAKLDRLFVMRAYLLQRALQNPRFVHRLAAMAIADARDHRTEHGGYALWNAEQRELRMVPEASLSFNDHQNMTRHHDHIFRSMLFGYHFHAVDDFSNQECAGPSGNYQYPSSGGDLAETLQTGMPGLVITYLGKNSDGTVRLNCDLYYVEPARRRVGEIDDLSLLDHVFILDLGVWSAPRVEK